MTQQLHHLEPAAAPVGKSPVILSAAIVAPARSTEANLLVSITFLSLLHAAGNALTFWIYAFLALVTLVFVWFIVPETKGKTLEQIEAYWHNGRHWVAAPAAEKPAEPTGATSR